MEIQQIFALAICTGIWACLLWIYFWFKKSFKEPRQNHDFVTTQNPTPQVNRKSILETLDYISGDNKKEEEFKELIMWSIAQKIQKDLEASMLDETRGEHLKQSVQHAKSAFNQTDYGKNKH